MAQEDYKTIIKIEGDSAGAQRAIGRTAKSLENLTAKAKDSKSTFQDLTKIVNSLNLEDGAKRVETRLDKLKKSIASWRASFSKGLHSLAVLHLATEGLKSIIRDISTIIAHIKEWRNEAERTAFETVVARATHETKNLADATRQVNDQLKDQIGLLSRAAELRDMGTKGAQSFSDEQRNVNRAVELAGVTDPRQRQALEDRYVREDEARSRADRSGDIAERIRRLTAEANAYDKGAAKARDLINKTQAQEETERGIQGQLLAKNAGKSHGSMLFEEMFGLNSGHDEALKASTARQESLQATRLAAVEEERTFKQEAAYRRQQIQILQQQQKAFEQLGTSAAQVQEAAWAKIEAADAEASRKLSEKLATNEAADRWEREFAKASPAEKINMLQEKESSARNQLNTLQSALDVEMGKSVAERDEARMADLRSGIETAQGEMFAARRQREGLEAEAIGQRQSVSIGAGSRLNAMGLGAGSGVQRVQQEMVNSLKDLVRLGRDQLAALKDIQNEDAGATFQ